ncbi:hypothetical protein [Methanohalophilus profundi]|uniref:hypothetical protein n=1 Tax=Methanohalophilus profundi TaxID=2138083 RepID=UPI00101CB521|nr:hypothetical protein [Methanohalophilus profundi]
MDKTEYNEIHRSVTDASDFEKLALDYCQPVGVVASILHQKIIDHVKKKHYIIQNKKCFTAQKMEKRQQYNSTFRRIQVPSYPYSHNTAKRDGDVQKIRIQPSR